MITWLLALMLIRHGPWQGPVYTFTPSTLTNSGMFCEIVDPHNRKEWWKVKNCQLVNATLDDIVNEMGRQRDAESLCGAWGVWVHDKNGKIIGKFRNPPCHGKK